MVKMTTIEFRHPVTNRVMSVEAPEESIAPILELTPTSSLDSLDEHIDTLSLPWEVRLILKGLTGVKVRMDKTDWPIGQLFIQDVLDLTEERSAYISHSLAAYVGLAMAEYQVARWLFSMKTYSLYMYLNLDPGFYRKVGDEQLMSAIRSHQSRLFGQFRAIELTEG